MSRIGKLPISLPENLEVSIEANKIKVKWKLWELEFVIPKGIKIKKEENTLIVEEPKNEENIPMWWTTRSILENMVEWVTNGYKKSLEISWVWYKFDLVWSDKLVMSIWYSHKLEIKAPSGIKITSDEKEKNVIHISWIDKQKVWEFASKVRSKKKPEPYKWKWIKYVWEQIRRKAWKTGK